MTTPAEYTKDSLRQAAFARRVQMPLEDRKRLSHQIAENFFKHVQLPPKDAVISGYSPINGEVDVREILVKLDAMGYICTLPQVCDHEQRLAFLRWKDDMPLRASIYGIPEPDPDIAEEYIPDFLIMPMLAFDKDGNRIGYGSGNFDRTFDFIKKIKNFTTCAVAYQTQEVARVPYEAHDYPMDMLVTEEKFYDFRSKK